jgi:HD-like signal output (HDOD) protein/prolyl-tRNA editing enzyme YbaK/EbsC (Cys-tRNA(Pro) deacylase)
MSMSDKVRIYLDQQAIAFRTLPQTAGLVLANTANQLDLPLSAIARAGVVHDQQGPLMVVFPADRRVDVDALNRQLQRDLRILPPEELLLLIKDSDPFAMPPLCDLYDFPAIIDAALDELDEVYFFDGSREFLLAVKGEDFSYLQADAWHGTRFTTAYDESIDTEASTGILPAVNQADEKQVIFDKLIAMQDLPAMPEMTQQLLQLRNSPTAGAKQLADVIEQDPSLTAQLIRYAKSPLNGYSGKLTTIRDVITLVLGYELVMDIALGVSLGRSFRNPVNGPLGLTSYWRHAVYSASLAQRLAMVSETDVKPVPGTAYLAGLLHNFGFLVMGHMFPGKFSQINETYQRNPHVPICDIEKQIFPLTHDEVGAWLLERWQLPAPVVTTARQHHNLTYNGEDSVYNKLVVISNRLLKSYDIGDAETDEIPLVLLESLGLQLDKVDIVIQMLTEQGRDTLNQIAMRMAA